MNYSEIMLDLETLGTEDHAAVVQIGAVRFDIYGAGIIGPDQFTCQVDWDSDEFGTIEPDTLQWWLSQDAAVRNRVFRQEGAVSLGRALCLLDKWVSDGGPMVNCWTCPPNFDARLLRQAYLRCKMPYRFPFYKERDMRTIREVFGTIHDKPEFEGDKHDALDDARHQAQWLINILRRVNGAGNASKLATDLLAGGRLMLTSETAEHEDFVLDSGDVEDFRIALTNLKNSPTD